MGLGPDRHRHPSAAATRSPDTNERKKNNMKNRIVITLIIAIVGLGFGAGEAAHAQDFETLIVVSAAQAGQTEDGLAYGPEDVIALEAQRGTEWRMAFDGSRYGLNARNHNVAAVALGATQPFIDYKLTSAFMSFTASRTRVPGITLLVAGQDVVRFDAGSDEYAPDYYQFSLAIDGSDIGLNAPTERIASLGYFSRPQGRMQIEHDCLEGLFAISTIGRYSVPKADAAGQWLNGSGGDVLLFCATQLGEQTEGYWYRAFNAAAAGLRSQLAIDNLLMYRIATWPEADEAALFFQFMVKRPFKSMAMSAAPGDVVTAWPERSGSDVVYDFFADPGFNELRPLVNGKVDALELHNRSVVP